MGAGKERFKQQFGQCLVDASGQKRPPAALTPGCLTDNIRVPQTREAAGTTVSDAVYLCFGLCFAYAVTGNAIVFLLLRRRKVPLNFMWSGTPGYLYRRCVDSGAAVGVTLRRFALSTNIAFFAAMLCMPVFVTRPAYAAEPTASHAALKAFLQEMGRDNRGFEDGTTRFATARVALDDKTPMYLVYVSGRRWCGSGGCRAFLLREEGSSFAVVQEFSLARLPYRVLCSKSNGWHDIATWVAGGGITKGYEVVLRFDGSRYPSNPSLAPAAPSTVLAACGKDLPLSDSESLYP